MRHEVVRSVRHRDREVRAEAGALALEERPEDGGHRAERSRCEVGDLNGRPVGCGVLEDAGPAEVVQVVSGSTGVETFGPEAGDGAVNHRVRHVLRPEAEALGDARTESLEDDVCSRAERERAGARSRFRSQATDSRAGTELRVPGRCGAAQRISLRRLHADDASAEATELPACEGTGEIPREVDDEETDERLHPAGSVALSSSGLTDRSIAAPPRGGDDRSGAGAEKRKLILDAAIRVFADHGYHGSRVGDIAGDAGVAHGLLYHYFASKEDVLRTIFVENWGQLITRFRAIEAADEPAPEKLAGIAKTLLRTWRNDPALVTVMVREVARSQHIQDQVDDVGEAFAIVERIIEEGQADGRVPTRTGRAHRELDRVRRAGGGPHRVGPRPAARRRGGRGPRRADCDRDRARRPFRLGSPLSGRVQPQRRRMGSRRGAAGLAEQGRLGGRAHRRRTDRRQHVRARAGRPAVAVPRAPCERGVARGAPWLADASYPRRRARAGRGRRRVLPSRHGRSASGSKRDGRADPSPHAVDARRSRHRRVLRQREGRRTGSRRETVAARPPGADARLLGRRGLAEGVLARQRLADDEGVYLVRPLVREHGLEVVYVPDHGVLERDTVRAEDRPRAAGDLERAADVPHLAEAHLFRP